MPRPKIFRTPEELKELQKKRRKKYRGYNLTYQKLYYLKKKLANPDYNIKNNLKKTKFIQRIKKKLKKPSST